MSCVIAASHALILHPVREWEKLQPSQAETTLASQFFVRKICNFPLQYDSHNHSLKDHKTLFLYHTVKIVNVNKEEIMRRHILQQSSESLFSSTNTISQRQRQRQRCSLEYPNQTSHSYWSLKTCQCSRRRCRHCALH